MRNEALRQEQGGEVMRLRAQLERVQGRRLEAPVLPTHPAFASLLPGRGLRPGAAYSLGRSASLLLALMSRPSVAPAAATGLPGRAVRFRAAAAGVARRRFGAKAEKEAAGGDGSSRKCKRTDHSVIGPLLGTSALVMATMMTMMTMMTMTAKV